MKPAPFEYHRPTDMAQALELVATLENSKLLAGGQSLVAMMNFRFVQPDHLIDLARIGELSGIEERGDMLRIGAMTRQRELEFSDLVARRLPLMHAALDHVGHRQTRNRGTIGGSLSHNDPSAELPLVALAFDAIVELASRRGRRRISARDYLRGYLETALEADEILVAIEFPCWREGHGFGFHEFARRHGDFAIAGAAAMIELGAGAIVERLSITLNGVGATALRLDAAEAAMIGHRLDPVILRRAVLAEVERLEPVDDVHASADYRRHLAKMLTMRAIADAAHAAGAPMARI